MECFVEDLAKPLANQFASQVLTGLDRVGGDFEPHPSDGDEDAVVLQLLVSAGDGVGVEGQFPSEFSDRGNQVSRLDGSASHGVFDLPDDLVVDGQPIGWVDMEKHEQRLLY